MYIKKIKNDPIDENTFIIHDKEHSGCMIVDPFDYHQVVAYASKNKLDIDYIILTHEHIDHIGGVNHLRELYKCRLICSRMCSDNIQSPQKNLARYFKVLLDLNGEKSVPKTFTDKYQDYACSEADIKFDKKYNFEWNNLPVSLTATPGHTAASICMEINGEAVFCGDSLMKNFEVTTKPPTGSKSDYETITLPFFKSLKSNIAIYPGHGEIFELNTKCLG